MKYGFEVDVGFRTLYVEVEAENPSIAENKAIDIVLNKELSSYFMPHIVRIKKIVLSSIMEG